MARPYYSKIAKAWHDATGAEGGPLKKLVLNDLLLDRIGSIDGLSLLEIGAGTGIFTRRRIAVSANDLAGCAIAARLGL